VNGSFIIAVLSTRNVGWKTIFKRALHFIGWLLGNQAEADAKIKSKFDYFYDFG